MASPSSSSSSPPPHTDSITDEDDKLLLGRPAAATWRHQLAWCWLSPTSWRSVAKFRQVDLRPLYRSVVLGLAALVAPVGYRSLWKGCGSAERSTSRRSRSITNPNNDSCWLLLAWGGGTVVMAAIITAAPTLVQLCKARAQVLASRCPTKASAQACLAREIRAGRAYRTDHYDVYLPSAMTAADATATVATTTAHRQAQPAILFFPGAHVEHAAYAEPAAWLARQGGYLVVVVSAEPLLLVDAVPLSNVRRIRQAVEARHGACDWKCLAGHSMGALRCTQLARPLNVRRIVLWGCGA